MQSLTCNRSSALHKRNPLSIIDTKIDTADVKMSPLFKSNVIFDDLSINLINFDELIGS